MWANPTPQGDRVVRARFASGDVVYGVTEGGAVVKSVDAGATWEVAYKVQASQVTPGGALYGLHFIDAQTGWVVGSSGQVTFTNDGGHTWNDRSVTTNGQLRSVCFTSSTNGFVVGLSGEFYCTADGGLSWMAVSHPAGSLDLNAIVFSGTTGWVGGEDGVILRSDDNGATWVEVATLLSQTIVAADDMSGGLAVFATVGGATLVMNTATSAQSIHSGETTLDVQFDDRDNGTVLFYENNASYVATVVAGVWSEYALGQAQIMLTAATNGNKMVAAGWHGGMAYSVDGGMTWTASSGRVNHPNPETTQLMDVGFGNANNGVAVGDDGLILRTTDGGVTWSAAASGTSQDLIEVWLHSSGRGYAVGEGTTALRTTDFGATWSALTVPVTVNRLRGVCMWDELNGIIVGDATASQETILITGDGGDTWVNKGPTVTPIVSLSAFPTGPDTAYVGQANGLVLRTLDKGESWEEFDSGTNNGIFQLSFVSFTHGWGAVRQHDMVFTQDAGETWTRIGPGTLLGSVWQVHFVNQDVGIAVGTSGNLMRSDDGGASWYWLGGISSLWSHMRAIWMTSETDGVVVGSESKIIYTRSAGLVP